MTGTRLGLRAVTCIRWLVALGSLPAVLAAQVTLERTYGGPAEDHIGTVRQTTDGGYILATGGRESARKFVLEH